MPKRNVPPSCRPAYDKAMTGRSRAAGIKAFCYECMGYNKAEVPRCTDSGCPLFLYRPGSNAAAESVSDEQAEARAEAGRRLAALRKPKIKEER